jgi:restriction endonuclease S subunit
MQERENDIAEKIKQVQSEITKNRQKLTTNMSKAQLKKQEKAYQQAWTNTNTPKDSMQLYNAVQYLQNALIAIQNEIGNS